MNFRVIKQEDRLESSWSGGKTYELAIFPAGAKYLDRDFLWRLSTANSDREESSFTRLEDYDRILMVLEGDVVLAYGDQGSVHLGPLDQDQFDGAVKTRCFGKLIRDYNLIYAKGCRARMDLQELQDRAAAVSMSAAAADQAVSYGIFCLDGYGVVSCGERSEMLRPGQQCVIDFPGGASHDIHVSGQGKCILTEIIMPVPKEKAACAPAQGTADHAKAGPARQDTPAGQAAQSSFFTDYMDCLKLYFSRNRWSLILRREGRSGVYYDRVLSEALQKIERRYVTLIIWILGVIVCALPAFGGIGAAAETGIILLFTLVHLFVIAPCIYMKLLPRPLSAHMKSVDSLNAAEQAFHQEEIKNDPHFEKLMRKYKSDDENYFADEASPLYRFMKRKDQ